MASRIRSENQGSSPRSIVTVAMTATRIAGSAAMKLNRPTIRTCSPAAAAPALRARISTAASKMTITISARISSAFSTKTPMTTSCTGAIGVAPDSTRKVSSAETRARTTMIPPIHPETWRGFSSARGTILVSLTETDTMSDNSKAQAARPSPVAGDTDAPTQRCCQNMT